MHVLSGDRLGSLFTVALSLGLRQGECVGLRWEEVDLDAARLTVVRQITRTNRHVEAEGDPKTRRSRRPLILPRVCVDQLVRHHEQQSIERHDIPVCDDRDLVWYSEAGTALSPSNLRRILRRQCELAGIRQVTFHTLRHSAATLLLAQGVPSPVILDVLGHQDLRMLRRYQHVTDSLRQDAAQVIDSSLLGCSSTNDEAPDRRSGATWGGACRKRTCDLLRVEHGSGLRSDLGDRRLLTVPEPWDISALRAHRPCRRRGLQGGVLRSVASTGTRSRGDGVIRELHEEDTALAYAAMAELRTHLTGDCDRFVTQVNEVQRQQGYRLFAAFDDAGGEAAAVAGFRRLSSLSWGDVLYIDDLSTRATARRRGHGRALLAAVEHEARELGCVAVHLDSGHQRYDAHRLYLGVGYAIRSHHFIKPLSLG